MFDLGWTELVFLVILALVVVGPRDLPRLARGVGELVGKLQRFARQTQFNLRRLEHEIESVGRQPAEGKDLLPDFVRQRMEEADPVSPENPAPAFSRKGPEQQVPDSSNSR